MNRILLGAVAVLLALSVALGFAVKRGADRYAEQAAALQGAQKALAVEVDGREADRKAWLGRVQKEQALKRQKDAENATLQEALRKEQEWADQPVPCAVAAALGVHRPDCPK